MGYITRMPGTFHETHHGSVFPSGARVYVDGETEAIVKQAFPNGSTSYLFPHYKLDFVKGDTNVAVRISRVGVDRKK